MSQGLCYKVVNWEVVGVLYLLLYGGVGEKVMSRAYKVALLNSSSQVCPSLRGLVATCLLAVLVA